MPKIRVKAKPQRERDFSPNYQIQEWDRADFLPQIGPEDAFKDVVRKLSSFFAQEIELPCSFEQLRTTSAGQGLRQLVAHLSKTCTNPTIINALLSLRWHYGIEREHRSLNEARANACEIVAWRFLACQSERDAVDYCLNEIRGRDAIDASPTPAVPYTGYDEESNERSPLLRDLGGSSSERRSASMRAELRQVIPKLNLETYPSDSSADGPPDAAIKKDRTAAFRNLNALQIAVIANAKHFLSQPIVQKIIEAIWHGDIIFWDSVSAYATKKPRYYNPRTTDPFSRLRVPKYLKAWEVAFFVTYLALYYAVVVERSFVSIPPVEILFYVWLVSYFWDEVQEWQDAGVFYLSDIWNIFDMTVIAIGFVFAILRVIGISYGKTEISDIAFTVLSLQALLLVPRIGSFLSLSPYWGTLIPCLKEMGKDFIKFMILVIIIYLGFLTTFTLVARDTFTFAQMTLYVTKIFYGDSGIAFGIMDEIDPNFGPPLMILFVTLSSILLTGSLTGMLSNSFGRVMAQAREEYLYFYSVYVLEASTSSRLTHFLPPLNIVALVFFRPWQVIFSKDDRFRHGRVVALKATHFPIVALIYAYEWIWRKISRIQTKDEWANFTGSRTRSNSEAPRMHAAREAQVARGGRPAARGTHTRRFSNQLSPDAGATMRPGSNRGMWSGTDEEDIEEPSNAELLKKIEQLTALVMTMQEQQQSVDQQESTHQES